MEKIIKAVKTYKRSNTVSANYGDTSWDTGTSYETQHEEISDLLRIEDYGTWKGYEVLEKNVNLSDYGIEQARGEQEGEHIVYAVKLCGSWHPANHEILFEQNAQMEGTFKSMAKYRLDKMQTCIDHGFVTINPELALEYAEVGNCYVDEDTGEVYSF